MTAREYYERFQPTIFQQPTEVMRLLTEFNNESKEICLKRKTNDNDSVVTVFIEQNNKWNDLVLVFQRHNNGKSPILVDGFKRFWFRKLPHLVEL